FSEVYLPGLVGGSRSTVWADYNGDGRPDILLATVHGPKLYTNLGSGQFRDDSYLLPNERSFDLTAAAWIDADGDGHPDVLLANGFHGLRLYKNRLASNGAQKMTPKLGPWSHIGPFEDKDKKGVAKTHPPETEVDLKKQYPGRNGNVAWKPSTFADGTLNNLSIYPKPFDENSAIFATREIEAPEAMVLPVSLGCGGTVSVWLNGEKLVSERADSLQDPLKIELKLKAGKNILVFKSLLTGGSCGFTFATGIATYSQAGWFTDVSTEWGFGPDSVAASLKGDSLAVADVNGDGRPDFLFGADKGMLFVNTRGRFELKSDSGLAYQTAKAGAYFADFDGDGHLDLFIPQRDQCKLYRNDGTGKFTDVIASTGDLAKPLTNAVSAAWGDFNNDGKIDLVVGCLRGSNRYFENNGNGTFTDKSVEIGLDQRIFNSQSLALADLNNDGKLDLILNNEGQDSAVLFGSKEMPGGKFTSVVVQLGQGSVGSRLKMLDKDGKSVAMLDISGGEGRGGQPNLLPRFTLPPGAYKLEVRSSVGATTQQDLTVADTPLRIRIGMPETMPPKTDAAPKQP
ncbi:MAG: VCBS repeat-containing protein, partial [Planctomycetes bacterium]|nr:VCBS repeat-containing protein [Planctomycetota bacterium]